MSVNDIRQDMAKLAAQARAKFDEITDETPEERAADIEREFDAMMAEHDGLGKKAERMAKLEAAEALANAPDARAPRGADARAAGVDEIEPVSYRAAFHEYLRAKAHDRPMDSASRAVLERGYSAMPAEERAQMTAPDAAGGYTVPEEMMRELTRSMKAWGPMYDPGVCRELVTSGGNPMPLPTVDDTASTAEPHTEGATLTDDGGKDVAFGGKALGAYAFDTEWLRVSKELADDSFLAMESLLGDLLGERLGRKANEQLTVGTGSSAPNGIVTASGLGVTAGSATALAFDEIIDLEHSVDPAYRQAPSCAYMLHDTTLAALRKLKDGDGNYLWQEGNVKAGVPSTLNGKRYIINQAMPTIATGAKAIVFGDLKKYFVRKVGAPLVGAIQDKDFWPGFGVAGYIRFDGELADAAAVKHLIMG